MFSSYTMKTTFTLTSPPLFSVHCILCSISCAENQNHNYLLWISTKAKVSSGADPPRIWGIYIEKCYLLWGCIQNWNPLPFQFLGQIRHSSSLPLLFKLNHCLFSALPGKLLFCPWKRSKGHTFELSFFQQCNIAVQNSWILILLINSA